VAAAEKDISKQLNRRRVLIPLLIGLTVSVVLLVYNLNQVQFKKVESGAGTHAWVDANNNGKPDFSDEAEFVEATGEKADFIMLTYSKTLASIRWTWESSLWIFLAIVMMGFRDFGYMLRIRILTDKFLSWRQSFSVIMIWEFASALTPGVVGGAAVAMFILNREKVPLGRSTAIVVITAILDNLFYIVMVPAVLLYVGAGNLFPPLGDKTVLGMEMNVVTLFWVAYGIVCFLFVFLTSGIFFIPGLIKRTLVGIFSLPALRRWKDSARKTGDEIIITSKELRNRKSAFWLKAFGATFMSWTGRFLVVNCLIMAFADTGIIEHLTIYARQLGMWVIMLVSPTPGGSGVAEYAFSGFLEEFVPFGLIGLMAILWRLVSYYPYLFIGSVLLPRWLRSTATKNKAVHES